jgi:phosphoglycolate phosphatase
VPLKTRWRDKPGHDEEAAALCATRIALARPLRYIRRPFDTYVATVKYKLAIFDLDGTLSDSFPWFLRIVNSVADRHGFRRLDPADIENLRGQGSREIVRYFQVPFWKLPMVARDMRRLKAEHVHELPLFPGVDRLFQSLRRTGVRIAMVSSDGEDNVRAILGPANAALVDHYACGASLFGKTSKLRQAVKAAGVAPADVIYTGDEVRDLEAAREAGVAFGAVAWGYAKADALKARQPDEFFATMDEMIAGLAGG